LHADQFYLSLTEFDVPTHQEYPLLNLHIFWIKSKFQTEPNNILFEPD